MSREARPLPVDAFRLRRVVDSTMTFRGDLEAGDFGTVLPTGVTPVVSRRLSHRRPSDLRFGKRERISSARPP